MQNIKIALKDGAKMPSSESNEAAGWDVYLHSIKKDFQANNLETRKTYCGLGISVEIPKGYYLKLVPRSSITKHEDWVMQNSPGIIDSDFRGEIQMRFISSSYSDFPYKIGDRIGQLILCKKYDLQWEQVEALKESQRGKGGFGSTGME